MKSKIKHPSPFSPLLLSPFSLLLFSLLLFSCCQSPATKEESASTPAFAWSDSYNRTITLSALPQRIISLSPAITEIIFLLESEELLVGISDFCTYPPETEKVTKVGGLLNFSIENLVSLNPDVVLIGSIIPKEDVKKMEEVGITVIAIKEEEKIEGIYHTLQIVGKLLDKEDLAKEKVTELQAKMAGITSGLAQQTECPSIYYVVGFGESGDFTAPGNSHINEIITLAGGKNIGEPLSAWNISREYLFEQDPDIIFVRKEDQAAFCKMFPYTQLKAVKEKRVYPIESGWIDIVSPRNILAVEMMHERVRVLLCVCNAHSVEGG